MAINHSNCSHPRTPAGRRACRAGQGAPARDNRPTPNPEIRAKVQESERKRRKAIAEANGPGALGGCICKRHVSAAACAAAAFHGTAGVSTDEYGEPLAQTVSDAIVLPGDVVSDSKRRAALKFDNRCGNVNCPHPRTDHVAGISCLNMGGGVWKSNVKRDAAAFHRMYPNRPISA